MKCSNILAALLLMGCLFGCRQGTAPETKPTAQKTEESKPFQTYSLAQFIKTVSISGGSFNPAEDQLLVSSNETGIFNAYTLNIADGTRTAITESTTDTTFAVSFFPHDERTIFTRDQSGNENNHLFVRSPDGTVQDITEGENTKEAFSGFAHDGKSFYVGSNQRDPKFFDLYEVDGETLERNMIYKNEDGLNAGAMSRDKRWLALNRVYTRTKSDIYLSDLTGDGEPKMINDPQVEATISPVTFGPENKYFYYRTDQGHEFSYLMRYEIATGKHEEVRKDNWDVDFISFSHGGNYQVIGLNWDGSTRLEITHVATGQAIEIPGLPKGDISSVGFSRSEKWMRFYLVSDASPRNLFVYNLETKELKRLTDNLNPEIHGEHLVSSELIRFKARDGLEIPAYLYKPKNAGPNNKVPGLLWIHGGPGGQSRPVYSAEKQFLINHGYALFVVNNRGSSGYGKTFFAADDQKHGREPLWDCVDAKDYLKTLDWIDGDKIGIAGGSYGGYMVLAGLAFEPDAFQAGVDIFGVSNWIRTLESIPPYWEAMRNMLYAEVGDPQKDRQFLMDTSPVFHGDKITKPLIILQGATDPRVLKQESDDMVSAIRENNGIVEYVVFEDEGHGFTKNENRIKGFNAVLSFLDKHLKKEDQTNF